MKICGRGNGGGGGGEELGTVRWPWDEQKAGTGFRRPGEAVAHTGMAVRISEAVLVAE